MRSQSKTFEATIDKLVHGGQGLGVLEGGKKALVWNTLPGEKVKFGTTRSKSSFVEGIATDILEASHAREKPRDDLYLSTSPWQMMNYEAENKYKREILAETLQRAGVDYEPEIEFHAPTDPWHYRNKMEYSFFGDEDGLHLALYNRGTHQKQVVTGSSIARPEIDKAANAICEVLDKQNVRASDLKSLIVRCNQEGDVVAALFTRNEDFPKVTELENICKGIIAVYSNPKSPASVRTKDLYKYGDVSLSDTLLDTPIGYDVFSFFQVNLPVFKTVLQQISQAVGDAKTIDMFSGVGTIGLSLPQTDMLIESEPNNVVWAKRNTGTPRTAEVIHATSERALEYIDDQYTLIVDPPRAGLHKDLIDRIPDVKPPKIVYLSCNPSTQARDLKLLEAAYKIDSITGYNFFPRTPHIEALAILVRE